GKDIPSQTAGQAHKVPSGPAEPRHTAQGAPTDAAHQDAGDGALTASVPAGLTREQLAERARTSGRDDAGTE
ncbi:MAG TPA: hypothetical protein VHO91_20000, partial [Rhodopila sp.]|nr:hypothetical protein [Rhodopila sp.]